MYGFVLPPDARNNKLFYYLPTTTYTWMECEGRDLFASHWAYFSMKLYQLANQIQGYNNRHYWCFDS